MPLHVHDKSNVYILFDLDFAKYIPLPALEQKLSSFWLFMRFQDTRNIFFKLGRGDNYLVFIISPGAEAANGKNCLFYLFIYLKTPET